MNKEQNEQKVGDQNENDKKQTPKIKIKIEAGEEAEVAVKDPAGAADVVINGEKTSSTERAKPGSSNEKGTNEKTRDSSEEFSEALSDGDSEHAAARADKSKESSSEKSNGSSGEAAKPNEEKNSEGKKDSKKLENELDDKDQQLRKIQQSLLETELKVLKLEGEIQRLNEQYTKKVTEKALEAQKLVDKRLSELQEEFSSKAAEAKKYALTSGAGKLAELLQNFEMVLSTSQKAGEAVKNYSQGFVMVFEMMNKTLGELGITPIEVKPGDDFDHDTMEIFEGVDTKEFKHNQVVEVLKKGYRLHDKVIAHAIVKVAN